MRFRGSVLARADAAGYKGDCLQDAQGRVKKKKKKDQWGSWAQVAPLMRCAHQLASAGRRCKKPGETETPWRHLNSIDQSRRLL